MGFENSHNSPVNCPRALLLCELKGARMYPSTVFLFKINHKMNLKRIAIVGVAMFIAYSLAFRTESVLVVDACSPDKCKWESKRKSAFDGSEHIWSRLRERDGAYAVFNNTGHSLTMHPVNYSRGGLGNSSTKSFRIPAGKSVQTTRPNFIMESAPLTIKTSSYSAVTTRWELRCY